MQAAVSAQDLVQAIRDRGGRSELGGSVQRLPARVAELRQDDELVLVLGAGDIDRAVEEILLVL
ncbi:MAG TPA: hypothetical protein VK348_01565, partial [Planctomycetota bacterium]|nr:hypothetical protein [Planctomycetota bacterium]